MTAAPSGQFGRIVVVTGTNTDVGKTIATAALAARASAAGESVLVIKPVQTGIAAGDPGDADVVGSLVGCGVRTLTALDDPLAPDTAARLAGVEIPPVVEYVEPILAAAREFDTVIVEGAGGVLVRLDTDGGTLLNLAELLVAAAPDAVEVIVVCAAGLGTLNHSELTVDALRARGLPVTGLIIGAWPDSPALAERCNRDDLPMVTGVDLLAVLPAGVGTLSATEFVAAAPSWFC